ncbi:MAG: YihY/virulence factor BrkB family protein [Streptosporangiaceae bacterium]
MSRLWRSAAQAFRVLWLLTRRTLREVFADRILGLAAQAAFWSLLSLPPLALVLLGSLGYVGEGLGPQAIARLETTVVGAASEVLTPDTVREVVKPFVTRLLLQGHPNLASIGFVISLWSGSAAMGTYVKTITIAYDMGELRGAWQGRAIGFILNIAALAAAIVLLPLLALGPEIISGFVRGPVGAAAATLVHAVYWPVLALLAVAVVATLYHVSVPVRTPWHRDLPGALLAVGLWVGGSLVLRGYLTSSLRSTDYGPLGAPIAALLFLYILAFAILLGAELNSEIDAMWPADSTAEGRLRSQTARDRAPVRSKGREPDRPRRPP